MSSPLGIDNYALRGRGWPAARLLDYVVRHGLDRLFLSDLKVFPDRSERALRAFGRRATDSGIVLHVGMLSICPGSMLFDAAAGSAADQLRETIRVAAAVGSPIARCVLGRVDDRLGEGGIARRIEETLEVLSEVRPWALDHGVRIAVENHSGDLRSMELRRLIELAGADCVGAVYDLGNTLWAMEDPQEALETLAPLVVSTGIRDGMVWRTEGGAFLQWTAVGNGLVDWEAFLPRFSELCPGVPLMLETISGRPNGLPLAGVEATPAFRRLLDRGRALSPGPHADADYQQKELERSLAFLRRRAIGPVVSQSAP